MILHDPKSVSLNFVSSLPHPSSGHIYEILPKLWKTGDEQKQDT